MCWLGICCSFICWILSVNVKVITWYSNRLNIVPKMAVRQAIQNVNLIIFYFNFYHIISGFTLICHDEYIVNNVNVWKPYLDERKLVESLNKMLICFCTFRLNFDVQNLSYYSKLIYLTTIKTYDI